MHNLGIGDLDFPEKHTLDQHRPNGYKVPDVVYDEETTTLENGGSDAETTTGMHFYFYLIFVQTSPI